MTTKSEWIESEYKKWEDQFVIPFEDEFNIRALLDLRWQFLNTTEQHIRTKSDLINTMDRLQKQICLKRRVQNQENVSRKIMIIVNSEREVSWLSSMFETNLDNIEKGYVSKDHAEFRTDEFIFSIYKNSGQNMRGHKCQVLIDLTDKRELNQIIFPVPVRR